jgi:hypothetical protein
LISEAGRNLLSYLFGGITVLVNDLPFVFDKTVRVLGLRYDREKRQADEGQPNELVFVEHMESVTVFLENDLTSGVFVNTARSNP